MSHHPQHFQNPNHHHQQQQQQFGNNGNNINNNNNNKPNAYSNANIPSFFHPENGQQMGKIDNLPQKRYYRRGNNDQISGDGDGSIGSGNIRTGLIGAMSALGRARVSSKVFRQENTELTKRRQEFEDECTFRPVTAENISSFTKDHWNKQKSFAINIHTTPKVHRENLPKDNELRTRWDVFYHYPIVGLSITWLSNQKNIFYIPLAARMPLITDDLSYLEFNGENGDSVCELGESQMTFPCLPGKIPPPGQIGDIPLMIEVIKRPQPTSLIMEYLGFTGISIPRRPAHVIPQFDPFQDGDIYEDSRSFATTCKLAYARYLEARDNSYQKTFSEPWNAIKLVMENSNSEKVAFDAKSVYRALLSVGIRIEGPLFDIKTASWLLDPEVKKLRIAKMSESLLNIPVPQTSSKAKKSGFLSQITLELSCKLRESLKTNRLLDALVNIEMPLVPVLAEMEWVGIGVTYLDMSSWRMTVSRRIKAIENWCNRQIPLPKGKFFHCLTSPKEVEALVYDTLQLLPVNLPNRPTSSDVLEKVKHKHVFVGLLLEHRKLSSLLNNNLNRALKSSFLRPGLKTTRVNGTFNFLTSTGRLTVVNPNLQNMPKELTVTPAAQHHLQALINMKMSSVASKQELDLFLAQCGDKKCRVVKCIKEQAGDWRNTSWGTLKEVLNKPISEPAGFVGGEYQNKPIVIQQSQYTPSPKKLNLNLGIVQQHQQQHQQPQQQQHQIQIPLHHQQLSNLAKNHENEMKPNQNNNSSSNTSVYTTTLTTESSTKIGGNITTTASIPTLSKSNNNNNSTSTSSRLITQDINNSNKISIGTVENNNINKKKDIGSSSLMNKGFQTPAPNRHHHQHQHQHHQHHHQQQQQHHHQHHITHNHENPLVVGGERVIAGRRPAPDCALTPYNLKNINSTPKSNSRKRPRATPDILQQVLSPSTKRSPNPNQQMLTRATLAHPQRTPIRTSSQSQFLSTQIQKHGSSTSTSTSTREEFLLDTPLLRKFDANAPLVDYWTEEGFEYSPKVAKQTRQVVVELRHTENFAESTFITPRVSFSQFTYPADKVFLAESPVFLPQRNQNELFPWTKNVKIAMRNAFVAAPGHVLLSVDYSQIEVRMMAHFSQDKNLIAALNSETDLFIATAARMLDKPLDKVTAEDRSSIKAVVYGILYGIGPGKLAAELHCSRSVSIEKMNAFKNLYPGLKHLLFSVPRQCSKCGFVKTLGGRLRYLPNINSTDGELKAKAVRQSINTLCQASAADIVKKAMVEVRQALQKFDKKCIQDQKVEVYKDEWVSSTLPSLEFPVTRQLLQIHDELLLEVPENVLPEVYKIVTETMENAAQGLLVPLKTKASVGSSWGSLKTYPSKK
eukprot:TRINITY_DN1285_c0_g2_i5.p1 TRINITY_DN1285_c0_g2~~TRINITY_DN1285_c0_g2_i5.p1  ORF type:complete len:1357 (+),score=380.00 TRINITY_DN1285_c0_g2_i5:761-4831(+)